VTATSLEEHLVTRILRAASGEDLFAWVLNLEQPAQGSHHQRWTLVRLDARTLEVRAQREFDGSRQLLLWPSVTGS
jgi:hypothetical protein